MARMGLVLLLSLGANFLSGTLASQDFLWQPLTNISSETLQKSFLPSYIDLDHEIRSNDNLSVVCKEDLRLALSAFRHRHTWAYQLFNSWARFPPSGVFSGTLTDFGDYDQCLGVKQIAPQYCLLDIAMPMPQPMPKYHNYYQKSSVLPIEPELEIQELIGNGTIYQHFSDVSSVFYYVYLQIGICLPQSCTPHDIESIATRDASKVGLKFKKLNCISRNDEPWKPNVVQTLAIISIIVMLAVTLSAAIYDRAVNKKTDNLSEKILLWFSPVRNVQKLICTKSYDDLTCIHGIRFVTIIWIIIGHTLEWNNLNIFRDTFSIPERLSGLEKQPLLKAHYSVDSFFYMSGLLTSYVTIKYTFGDYKNFKYISFFVLRYLRLTPQLGAFLLLFSLLPPMFDGPLWMTYMNKVTDKCYKTWWHNLLYLQNVIDIQNICAIHTWYLAADMQLHWMSLIPVVLLLKNRRNGIMFTKILILVCICFSAITIFIRKFPPGSVITSKNDYLDEDGVPSDFIKFFYKPWNHANVFFIGFIFGSYIQSNNNLGQYSLKKSTKYLYWLLAFAGYLFCMYSTAPWLHGRPYDPFWSAVLFPLNRTIWALVLTLVIWLCLTKNGSLVGRLLSWSGFRPLSRMTYSVYLTHSWVLWVVLGARRDLIDLSATFITLLCAGVIVLSYFIGFIFTILFETPLIHVIEYIKHTWLNDKANDLKVNQLTRQSEEKEDEKGVKLLEVQSSNL